MIQGVVLLVVGLSCLVGAAIIRESTAGPHSLESQAPFIQKSFASPDASTAESIEQMSSTSLKTRSHTSKSLTSVVSATPSPRLSARPSSSATPMGDKLNPGDEAPSLSGLSNSARKPGLSPSPPLPSPSSLAQLHRQAIVVDTHVETPLLITEKNVKLLNNGGQVSLQKMAAGGVDVVFFSIFVNPYQYKGKEKTQADFIIAALKQEVKANDKLIEMAYSHADIQRITQAGKMAGLMGMEGADPIGDSLANLDYFYKHGVRYLGPTWSTHTLMADSSGPPQARWKGLSKFGKMAVTRMNQLGLLIDVSHLSDAAFYDVLKTTTQPVIASHSAVDGIYNNARNLNDDMLKLLAVNGGVIGIIFYPPHLQAQGKANVKTVVDHIDYAIKVAGAEHVGLGSDFDGLDRPPPSGLGDASKFPAITAEMQARGRKTEEIYGVLGGNFMRVFAQVLK